VLPRVASSTARTIAARSTSVAIRTLSAALCG
jgi:hypothetical protein